MKVYAKKIPIFFTCLQTLGIDNYCTIINCNKYLPTFIPCHLEMALSGLNALKVLNDLKAVRLALLSKTKLRIETCKIKIDFLVLKNYYFQLLLFL